MYYAFWKVPAFSKSLNKKRTTKKKIGFFVVVLRNNFFSVHRNSGTARKTLMGGGRFCRLTKMPALTTALMK